jgi:hypothetical protein
VGLECEWTTGWGAYGTVSEGGGICIAIAVSERLRGIGGRGSKEKMNGEEEEGEKEGRRGR